MNRYRQMEVHYIDTGFPYTAIESFINLFEGLTHVPLNYTHHGLMHDQENIYWSMMNAYKFGLSGLESTSYCPYEENDHLPRIDVSQTTWGYPSPLNSGEPTTLDLQPRGDAIVGMDAIPEECIQNRESNSNSQVVWQDNINPDNMTYEELLNLGEAVGSRSRGLSKELIDLLPTSKCKFRSFFSRKMSRESSQHLHVIILVYL